MSMSRPRLWLAGVIAVLVGVPLSERAAAADGFGIAGEAIDLTLAIVNASGGS